MKGDQKKNLPAEPSGPSDEELLLQQQAIEATQELNHTAEGILLKISDLAEQFKPQDGTTPDQSAFGTALFNLLRGKPGEPGAPANPREVAEILKNDPEFMRLAAGNPGKDGEPGAPGKNADIEGLFPEIVKAAIDYFPTIEEIVSQVRPLIRDGEDGIDGKDGKDGKNGRDGSPDTGLQIRNKLRSLKEGERLSYTDLDDAPSLDQIRSIAEKAGHQASRDYDLRELKDVYLAAPSNGQVLSYDAATGKWINSTPAPSGVTFVSVVSANGFSGSVADPGTTPAITLSTTISGILKGDGTALSAASQGIDYYAPGGTDVAVADGGTGKSSWTQYLIPYAATATSFSQIPIGNAGEVLTSNGPGSAPSFQAAGSSGANTALSNLAAVAINTSLLPGTDDGAALGSVTKEWSDLFLASGGVINWANGDVTITHAANALAFAGASSGYTFDGLVSITLAGLPLNPKNTTDQQRNEVLRLEGDRATPANSDRIYQSFFMSNSTGGQVEYARLEAVVSGVIAGSEGGILDFWLVNSGTLAAKMRMTPSVLNPSTNDLMALGTGSLSWSDLFLASGAVINFNNGDVTITHSTDKLAFAGAASGYTFDNSVVIGHTATLAIAGVTPLHEQFGTAAASGSQALGMFSATAGTQAEFLFYRSKNAAIGSASVVASGDGLGKISWYGAQQTGTFATQTIAAQIRAEVDGAVTSGASGDMPGRIVFGTTPDGSGTLTDRMILDSAGVLKPNANDGLALGTGSLSWSDLFLASGGVINFNNGDVLITHSANTLSFTGAASGYLYDALNAPTANDGAALGSGTLSWADLFLASGGVINWANGNATLTHSTGLLTSNVPIVVPADAYGSSWNGSNQVPTKDAVYDKIETLAGFTPLKKLADQSRTGTSTLADDDTLFFTMLANTTYTIRLYVPIRCHGTGDFKYDLSGPSPVLVVGFGRTIFPNTQTETTQTINDNTYTNTAATLSHAVGADLYGYIEWNLQVIVGASGGTFSFRWAQASATANTAVVKAGAYMEYRATSV